MHQGFEDTLLGMTVATAGYQGSIGHLVLRDHRKDAVLGLMKRRRVQLGCVGAWTWSESKTPLGVYRASIRNFEDA